MVDAPMETQVSIHRHSSNWRGKLTLLEDSVDIEKRNLVIRGSLQVLCFAIHDVHQGWCHFPAGAGYIF
jgi:hypothetical protein